VTGYLDGDERIVSYIDEVKPMANSKKAKSKKLRQKGEQTLKDFSLSSTEVEDIFDLLEEEFEQL
jgi:DNA-binding protein Fis